MKRILRAVAHRKANESGFAMPVAIGFGLVTLLVAGTLLLRSQDDQTSATLQRSGDSSSNIAEAGITRIQAFLNTYRLFAKYNLNQWSSNSTLLNAYTVNSNCLGGGRQDPDDIISPVLNQQWQSIGSPSLSNARYRLVDYVYDATRQQGTLTVDGCVGGTCSGNEPETSFTRLRVVIPVQDDEPAGIPGLWVTNGVPRSRSYEVTNNNGVEANALLNDCRVPLDSIDVTGNDPGTNQPYIAQHTLRQFPDLPTRPSAPGTPPRHSDPNVLPMSISSALTLPQSADRYTSTTVNGQTVRVYQYLASGNVTFSSDITIDTAPNWLPRGQRAIVKFYLGGSLESRGSADIRHDCTGVSTCSPSDFQMFGYGTSGSQICLNGNDYIDAFILAPAYTAGVAGAARRSSGPGGFRGAVWVSTWSTSGGCGSNTNNVAVTQTANWNLTDLAPDLRPLTLGRTQCWERLEVSSSSTTPTTCN